MSSRLTHRQGIIPFTGEVPSDAEILALIDADASDLGVTRVGDARWKIVEVSSVGPFDFPITMRDAVAWQYDVELTPEVQAMVATVKARRTAYLPAPVDTADQPVVEDRYSSE